jgi:hypothetical protein
VKPQERPDSQKHILVELTIGNPLKYAFNDAAFSYYMKFSAIYPLIDPAFLVGVEIQTIETSVGFMGSDAAPLLQVGSKEERQDTEMSFYWDGSDGLYFHLQNGDRPSQHNVTIGIVYGIANHAGKWGTTYYHPGLISAPAISKNKDPLSYGIQEFGGGTLTFENKDGELDELGDLDVRGNVIRILIGFDDQPYNEFIKMAQGFVNGMRINDDEVTVEMKDPRKALSQNLPNKVFTVDDYPNLDPDNEGKSIPVGYGVLRDVDVLCVNDEEAPAPATYVFKLIDCSTHPLGIKSIDEVRVKDVAKIPSSTDLINGTFGLAAADYDPGDKVTCDFTSYVDAAGDTIENAIDIIQDLFESWLLVPYKPASFNQGEWEVARLIAEDLAVFMDEPKKIRDIIGDLCASTLMDFIPLDDGRYSARFSQTMAPPKHTFSMDELLESIEQEFSSTEDEIISSTLVKYNRSWSTGKFLTLHDTSQEEEIFLRCKERNERSFETLLKDAASAQRFSDKILAIAGYPRVMISPRTMTQSLGLEINDMIQAPIGRRTGVIRKNVKAEVCGKSYDLMEAEITTTARITETVLPTVYVQGLAYWGMPGQGYGIPGLGWGASIQQEVA